MLKTHPLDENLVLSSSAGKNIIEESFTLEIYSFFE